MACGEEAQYALAKSVNQIMLLKFHRGTKILCCICQTPLSSLEGGLGSRLSPTHLHLFGETSLLASTCPQSPLLGSLANKAKQFISL